MRRIVLLVFATGVAAFLAAAVVVYGFGVGLRPASPTPAGPAGGLDNADAAASEREAALRTLQMPAFSMVDQDGVAVDETVFDGRVTVLDFFYTRCPLACPGMTAVMADVQTRLEGSGVQLVSISVDGEHDAPGVMRAYAEAHGAKPGVWRFLSGPRAQAAALLEQGLRLPLIENPDDPSGVPMLTHPTRLIVIGPDRSVRGFAQYTNEHEVELLVERARALAQER